MTPSFSFHQNKILPFIFIFLCAFSNGLSDGGLQLPCIITNCTLIICPRELLRVHQWELIKKKNRKKKGICFQLNLSLKFAWQFLQLIWPFPWHKKNSVMVERQWANGSNSLDIAHKGSLGAPTSWTQRRLGRCPDRQRVSLIRLSLS